MHEAHRMFFHRSQLQKDASRDMLCCIEQRTADTCAEARGSPVTHNTQTVSTSSILRCRRGEENCSHGGHVTGCNLRNCRCELSAWSTSTLEYAFRQQPASSMVTRIIMGFYRMQIPNMPIVFTVARPRRRRNDVLASGSGAKGTVRKNIPLNVLLSRMSHSLITLSRRRLQTYT